MTSKVNVPLLSPATLLSVLIRIGHAFGRTAPTIAFVGGKVFLDDAIPKGFRGYEPTREDVFITTFSKSGTNWAMQIAQQLVSDANIEFEHIHDVVPWPDAPLALLPMSDTAHRTRSPSGKRVIKTHLPEYSVPYGPDARYITVLRDPKEVVVSAYYFVAGIFGVLEAMDFERWFEHLVRRGPLVTAWVRHSHGFWQWRNRDNVLVLTYNEMKADLPHAVRRFADFIGLSPDDETFDEVVRRSGLEYMREHESQFAPPNFPLRCKGPHAKMVRRGAAGRSNELMTPEQQAEVDAAVRKELARIGSDLPYDELFG